jgi:predicted porin
MKKTLIAIAALAAFGAQAQSSVTLYGQFDAGVYSLKNIDSLTGAKSATVYGDGATFSNILGFKGTEDMGGGLKAGFDFQTDVQTNNGGTNTAGLFRRQANGSIASNQYGELKFGVTTNPIIATNGALMPVSGNSVSTATSSALGYADFYTKNAITYTTPSIMGLVGQFQQGMSNNVNSSSEGSVTAYSLAFVQGPLEVRYAAQDRKEAAVTTALSGANPSVAAAAAVVATTTASAVAAVTGDAFAKDSSVLGLKYKLGQFTFGAAVLENNAATAIGGAKTKKSGNQYGVGYTTGAWTLGATLTSAESSKLTNVQARYALSKRTNIIGTYGVANNDANGTVKFLPIAFNTGTAPAGIVTGMAGKAGVKQSAFGVALTHSF